MIEVEEPSVPEGMADPHYDLGLYLLKRELQSLGKSLDMYAIIGPVHVWNIRHGNPQIMHIEEFNEAVE